MIIHNPSLVISLSHRHPSLRFLTYCHNLGCNCGWGMDWSMDLLTTCTLHSELQLITMLLLISTIHKLPQHPLSIFQPAVFISRSLATAYNSGDSSASHAQVLCPSLPCRTLVNCQLNCSAVSSQLQLQSSTELDAPVLFFITPWHGLRC
jgi:hypothetical protein